MTVSAARERILRRVRDAVAGERKGDWQAELDRRMAKAPQLIRLKLPDDLFARFTDKLTLGGGSCEQIASMNEIATAIIRFLAMHGLARKIRVAPALQDMQWGGGLDVSDGNTRGDDLAGVTPAFCAVAETGSVVLLSSASSPTSLNFLPDVHIAIVEMKQLVPHYEDVWMRLRALGEVPRTVNFITGPSKTADVEQTLQIGAHGPRNLHVILVADMSRLCMAN